MKFEIIKNSESKSGFDVPDKEYKGQVDGLVHGWSFEFVNDKGEISYNSVYYSHGTPERNAEERYNFETERMNGWEPTGRVVFRGYATEHYDPEERDYYVKPVDDREIGSDRYPVSQEWSGGNEGKVFVRPHTRKGRPVKGFYRKRKSAR